MFTEAAKVFIIIQLPKYWVFLAGSRFALVRSAAVTLPSVRVTRLLMRIQREPG
jgi:hypothetical protein